VFEAIESAGLTLNKLSGSDTACYVGIMCQDFFTVQSQDFLSVPKYAVTGIAASNASSRVSYFFDWHGPSMTIDTACSSSMVCVSEAVNALRSGTSRVAIACGTNLLLAPFMYVSLSNVGMVSPTGRCHMWDEKADGYSRGEGVGALVLKTLSTAIADGDEIACVIREIGLNHDGRTKGLTMPSAEAQSALIRDVYKRAGLDPTLKSDRCQYFEAHGTGTPTGDPKEASALDQAFFPNHDAAEGELLVGSIKTVIGHTEGTAGIAGILKAALAVKHGIVPPNLLFNKLNPALEPFTKFLRIPVACEPWPAVPEGQPRRASINSFGFGGANAHCIIENFEPAIHAPKAIENGNANGNKAASINGAQKLANGSNTNGQANGHANGHASVHTNGNGIANGTHSPAESSSASGSDDGRPETPTTLIPLVFSASSLKSLVSVLEATLDFLSSHPTLPFPAFAHYLSSKRSALPLRLPVYAASLTSLRSQTQQKLSSTDPSASHSVAALTASPAILAIFTGQGAQWPCMGAKLFAANPFARKILSELDNSLASLPTEHRPVWKFSDILCEGSKYNVGEAAISQPICTAVQIVLISLLRLAGVKMSAVVGHSSGEIAAAYAAGFLSATDAVRVAYYRGFYAGLAGGDQKGGMIAAGTDVEDAEDLCRVDDMVDRLCVAAHNSPTSVTLSGDVDAVNLAQAVFEDEAKFARILKVDTAYHSAHMQPCSGPYLKALREAEVRLLVPDANLPRWFSSVHNIEMTPDMAAKRGVDGQYWIDNMVRPVLFYPALKACLTTSEIAFNFALEIGPHPALQGPAKECIQEVTGQDIAYAGTLKRGGDDVEAFADALGSLWARFGPNHIDLGRLQKTSLPDVDVKLDSFYASQMPSYPWTHETEYWAESRKTKLHTNTPGKFHDLLGLPEPDGLVDERRWRHTLSSNDLKWVAGHTLQGQVIFPATGYICMVAEAALQIAESSNVKIAHLDVLDMEIRKAIAVHQEFGVEVMISFSNLFPVQPDAMTETMTASFNIFSAPSRESTRMALHCCGNLRMTLLPDFGGNEEAEKKFDYESILPARRPIVPGMNKVDIDRFYETMRDEVGLGWDGAFRGLTDITRKAGYSTVTAKNPPFSATETKLLFHPAMLDCALQGLNAALAAPGDGSVDGLVAPTLIKRVTIIPELLRRHQEDEHVMIDCTSTVSPTDALAKISLTGDVEVYASNPASDKAGVKLIEMEGIKISPVAPPSAENDRPLFQESLMCLDTLNAKVARGNLRFSPSEKAKALDAERVAFYYIAQLHLNTPSSVRATLPPYRQAFLAECSRVYHRVSSGAHSFAPPSWAEDTAETIASVCARHPPDAIDFILATTVGTNLLSPSVLSGETNILQFMVVNNMLERTYTEGVGYPILNSVATNLIAQLCQKHPRMNMLEIGAGTGGSTASILGQIGESFRSYTYTDISSAFFERAQERFRGSSHKMVFKTLDISKDPVKQGFARKSYDVVIAQNVLHATAPLRESLKYARELLRPGGYLMLLELLRSDSMRFGLVVGCLPGWWVGEEDERKGQGGPLLTPDEWKAILSETGFAVDTVSEVLDQEDIWAVLSARAVDDAAEVVPPLMQPLDITPNVKAKNLLVVGGKNAGNGSLSLCEQVTGLVAPHYETVSHVDSLADLLPDAALVKGRHVLNLSDVDSHFWEDVTEASFENLKKVVGEAASMLWLLQDCLDKNPYAGATLGFLRTVRYELPDTMLQTLDIGSSGLQSGSCMPQTAQIVAECLLKLTQGAELEASGKLSHILWSVEPELYLEEIDGHLYVPRLRCADELNLRYNASKRAITRDVDLATDTSATPRCLAWNKTTSRYILREQHEFPQTYGGEKTVTVKVSCSFLSSLKSPAGFHFLCLGIDTTTGNKMLCFSDRQASIITVPSSWVVALDGTSLGTEDVGFMSLAVVDLLAKGLVRLIPTNGSVVVFDANPVAGALLYKQLADAGRKAVFISSKLGGINSASSVCLHPQSPQRAIDAALPPDVSIFIDASPTSDLKGSAKLAARIEASLPAVCDRVKLSAMMSREASGLSAVAPESIVTALRSAASFATMFSQMGPMPIAGGAPLEIIPLPKLLASPIPAKAASVIYWQVEGYPVPVSIEPVFMRRDLFRPDKTYWLAGLSGTLGLSLVDFLAAHNAKHIAISSRSASTAIDPAWVSWHRKRGVTVSLFSGDMTKLPSLVKTYKSIRRTLPPIAGVAIGAMVLIDSTFMEQRFEDFQSVMRPKVHGTLNMSSLFSCDSTDLLPDDSAASLDFFLAFSSLMASTGNPGQAPYGAGNCFLKALTKSRRDSGLAGSSIDIGRVSGVGYIERELSRDSQERLRQQSGTIPLSESDLHQLFAEAVVAGRPDSGVADPGLMAGIGVQEGGEKADGTFWAKNPRLAMMIREVGTRSADADNAGGATVPVRKLLESAKTVAEAREVILGAIRDKLAASKFLPDRDAQHDSTPLVDLGVDSLVAVNVRSWFQKELNVDVPVMTILGGASMADLVDSILSKLPKDILGRLEGVSQSAEVQEPSVKSVESNAGEEMNGTETNGEVVTVVGNGLKVQPVVTVTELEIVSD